MKKLTQEEIISFIEQQEWSVTILEDGFDIGKYSPLGEDFSIFICPNEISFEGFAQAIRDYEFDVDDHAAMWIENRGKNGTPNSVSDLVDDAKAIEEMLDDLVRDLRDVGDGRVSLSDEAKDAREASAELNSDTQQHAPGLDAPEL